MRDTWNIFRILLQYKHNNKTNNKKIQKMNIQSIEGHGQGGGFLPPPLQNFLEDQSLI